jgi:molybdenum cofactor biosynthesis protein B
MGIEEHREQAEKMPGARCAVLTVSDSRTKETDESGKLARELLEAGGHTLGYYAVVPNDPEALRAALEACLGGAIDLVLTIGGTGIGSRDRTVETASQFIERELPGFGELFRYHSLADIGASVILTRATMGITRDGKILVCTPGSKAAVRLALEKILLKELGHLVWELRKP